MSILRWNENKKLREFIKILAQKKEEKRKEEKEKTTKWSAYYIYIVIETKILFIYLF